MYNAMTKQEFSTALQIHYDYLFRFARKLSGCEPDAEDLVQNASIKGYRNREKLDDVENFKPWMSTILYNIFVSEYKKQRRRRELLSINGSSESFFYNVSKTQNLGYDRLKFQDLIQIASNVGKKSFEAFELYLTGFSYKEIAESLRIAIGTVKSRINFVRKKVQEMYESLNNTDSKQLLT